MTVFFTADTHYNHKNLARGESKWDVDATRDFASVEEMNDWLVESINSVVGPRDTLFHLGDFALGRLEIQREFRERIVCERVQLLFGNHDKRFQTVSAFHDMFEWVGDYKEVKINGQHIVLCHYPFASWNRSHYGSWNLHGHAHGKMEATVNPWRCDVGIDLWERPVSFEELVRRAS